MRAIILDTREAAHGTTIPPHRAPHMDVVLHIFSGDRNGGAELRRI